MAGQVAGDPQHRDVAGHDFADEVGQALRTGEWGQVLQ